MATSADPPESVSILEDRIYSLASAEVISAEIAHVRPVQFKENALAQDKH